MMYKIELQKLMRWALSKFIENRPTAIITIKDAYYCLMEEFDSMIEDGIVTKIVVGNGEDYGITSNISREGQLNVYLFSTRLVLNALRDMDKTDLDSPNVDYLIASKMLEQNDLIKD